MPAAPPASRPCPVCHGTGTDPASGQQDTTCLGTGQVPPPARPGG
jgi:hypothetical protein